MRILAMALATVVLVACASTPAATSPAPSSSSAITKPPSTQDSLPGPTYVRWAVDKSTDAGRPYTLVLFYDGVATNFRIIDLSGKVVLGVPIMGSGIHGPDTCAVKARGAGKTEGFTGVLISGPALQQFMNNAVSYRAEADTVGPTVTVPLTDSGCRAS